MCNGSHSKALNAIWFPTKTQGWDDDAWISCHVFWNPRFYEADFQRSRVQHLAPSPLLPRELQITNLARTPQSIHKAYTSFEPVMASKANGPEAAAALAKLSASADQQVQQVKGSGEGHQRRAACSVR
eukprot:209058-Pelagomonas_calceolata.AAC.3